MIQITQLTESSDLASLQDLYRSSSPYSTTSYYVTTVNSSKTDPTSTLPDSIAISLTLKHNQPPVTGGDKWIPEQPDLDRYAKLLPSSLSFKAVTAQNEIIGIILGDPEPWNSTIKIWEFIVDKSVQRSGVGKRLMEAVIEKARSLGVTRIVCETQTRNVRALGFYFKMGFTMDAVDVSFYGVDDLETQDVGVFMKLVLKDGEDVGKEVKRVLKIEDCVNTHCPNCNVGNPVLGDSLTLYRGHVVGFCNTACRDEFDNMLVVFGKGTEFVKERDATASLDNCINSLCPNSNKPVTENSLTWYRGHVVGFCNSHCRDEFDNMISVFDKGIADKR
ncbi:UNVERIFIED_CONTAM: hypothetical protein HDU68_002856 [Siphonaria sp. JEL0065]|nr:hypothetical protein HDU68_002856 [Siphonaria sp. JEL0065]